MADRHNTHFSTYDSKVVLFGIQADPWKGIYILTILELSRFLTSPVPDLNIDIHGIGPETTNPCLCSRIQHKIAMPSKLPRLSLLGMHMWIPTYV